MVVGQVLHDAFETGVDAGADEGDGDLAFAVLGIEQVLDQRLQVVGVSERCEVRCEFGGELFSRDSSDARGVVERLGDRFAVETPLLEFDDDPTVLRIDRQEIEAARLQ